LVYYLRALYKQCEVEALQAAVAHLRRGAANLADILK